MNETRTLGRFYDWLSRYNLLLNVLKFGRLRADLTMHKTLAIPEDEQAAYGEAERCLYINDRALDAAALAPEPRVLDAGCGFGGTVFRWHGRIGGSYDGLTLSRVQQRLARREARRRGLEDRCRFHLRSYDEPLDGPYDAVVSIEALIHSPRFEHTLAHLASALKDDGKLVIVEDILRDAATGDPDFETLRSDWGLAEVPTSSTYEVALAASRLQVLHDQDYSAGFETAPPEKLAELEARYLKVERLVPLAGIRFIARAFLGGLALERLYRKDLVRYRLIVARRE